MFMQQSLRLLTTGLFFGGAHRPKYEHHLFHYRIRYYHDYISPCKVQKYYESKEDCMAFAELKAN